MVVFSPFVEYTYCKIEGETDDNGNILGARYLGGGLYFCAVWSGGVTWTIRNMVILR